MSRNECGVHIALTGVSKVFDGGGDGPVTVLHGIDLEVRAGAFVAVVGRSGSGKSTLLNLIAGIDRPTSGQVRVGETRVQALTEDRLARWRGRQVGVVFQFFQLLPTLTVLDNVMLPMDFAGTLSGGPARRRALELLDRVRIADQAHKLPAALSGGQQQRAAIARALANDPPLVLADEPTGSLDSQAAGGVVELLAAQARAGKTVVLVTHEREVRRQVDEVITLADGRIAARDPRSAA